MKAVSIYDLEFLTTSDIAKVMRVSQQTVLNWINSNKLPCFKCDGVIRVAQNDFRDFVGLNTRG